MGWKNEISYLQRQIYWVVGLVGLVLFLLFGESINGAIGVILVCFSVYTEMNNMSYACIDYTGLFRVTDDGRFVSIAKYDRITNEKYGVIKQRRKMGEEL